MSKRWQVISAAVTLQTVLGGIYAWSTFTPFLEAQHELTKGQCGMIFGTTIAVFALVMIAAGKTLEKRGPQFVAGIGSALFTIGYLIASYSQGNFFLLLLGIGAISGSGIGFGYVCPLSIGMQWFPNHRGLITGVAVGGFGAGAILLSKAALHFLDNGMGVLDFFFWYALVSGAIAFVASMLIVRPPDVDAAPERIRREGIHSLQFWVLTICIFSGTFSGLLVVGNLVPLALDVKLPMESVALIVSLFAVGNVFGRIFWGYIFDSCGFISIPVSLGASALIYTLYLFPLGYWQFMAATLAAGMLFGANFVIYASAISQHFGMRQFQRLYPICFLGYGVAGITGPTIGGWLKDSSGSYDSSLHLCILISVVATLLVSLTIKSFDADRESVSEATTDEFFNMNKSVCRSLSGNRVGKKRSKNCCT